MFTLFVEAIEFFKFQIIYFITKKKKKRYNVLILL